MLIYARSRVCVGWEFATHLCDTCLVEYITPSLEVVMTDWASYKAVMS